MLRIYIDGLGTLSLTSAITMSNSTTESIDVNSDAVATTITSGLTSATVNPHIASANQLDAATKYVDSLSDEQLVEFTNLLEEKDDEFLIDKQVYIVR